MKIHVPPRMVKHQPDAELSQADPVQNTWYTILDTQENARIYCITVAVMTTDETLEARVTIDGQTLTGSVDATADAWYFVEKSLLDAGLSLGTAWMLAVHYAALEGRSVKVEVRKTTAAGTGTLMGRVIYAKL